MKQIKNFLRWLMLIFKRILYFIAKKTTKINARRIVFESFQGRSFSCNPKGIYHAMLRDENYRDFEYIWVFRDVEKGKKLVDNRAVKIVRFESFSYYKALAGAKYWVFNSNTRSFLKPRREQVFVQTWHGTPLKKIGCDVVKEGNAVTKVSEIPKIYNREAEKISYMISPSAYCTEKLISAFRLREHQKEDIVLEVGYPRNDSLFQYTEDTIKHIRQKLGIPSGKKVMLYAPTFRDNRHSTVGGFLADTKMDFGKMKENFGRDYVLLFRAHYFIAQQMNIEQYRGFVLDVSGVDDVNELYLISDLLITDYSSVFFDYANLRRPMFFYIYDYKEYKESVRDLYFDMKELPGPVVTSQEQLTDAIKRYDAAKWKERYERFHEKYNYLDDGNSGKRAVEKMISGQKSGK